MIVRLHSITEPFSRETALRFVYATLLTLKFGDLPAPYQQRIEQARDEELELWTERILFADSLDAVFA